MNYRIQIAIGGVLVGEVVTETGALADKIWGDWVNLRYKHKKPMGSAVINRSDIPRLWDVPVGAEIKKS